MAKPKTPRQKQAQSIKRRLAKHGLKGVNQPKMTPSHPKKKGVVLAKDGDVVKLLRFGDQGYPHNYSPEARANFKSRQGKNIARGPLSPAYWANKELWSKGGRKRTPDQVKKRKK